MYILGAGASCEIGLPSGEKLKKDISPHLRIKLDESQNQHIEGDRHIASFIIKRIKDNAKDSDSLVTDANQIANALPLSDSIDNYINCHRDSNNIKMLGKAAIIDRISQSEERSKLFNIGKSQLNDRLENTWYLEFFKTVSVNRRFQEFKRALINEVEFVVFNYDRCLEKFLFVGIQVHYGVSKHEALDVIKKLSIHRPYGSLGEFGGDEDYGFIDISESPQKIDGIRTFTEEKDVDVREDITDALSECTKLVFLGFAFHDTNMKFFKSCYGAHDKINIYATTLGISSADLGQIEENIYDIYENHPKYDRDLEINVVTEELTCVELFKKHKIGLRLS